MTYISRRIAFTREDGVSEEYLDTAFFQIDSPLVIIGEPGAGKSELANAMTSHFGGSVEFADILATQLPNATPQGNALLIVDGLDEVLAQAAGGSIGQVLSNLQQAGFTRFVLTCRAADWAHGSNKEFIIRRFGREPKVGRLLPFNDEEVLHWIEVNGEDMDGESFLKEARRHDAVDLVRNPQTLKLLVNAVQSEGWPATKTQLFESACRKFGEEPNPVHQSIQAKRPSIDAILSAAGFICAQVLLCGARGVKIDGPGDSFFVRLADLTNGRIALSDMRHATSSMLFRVSGPQTLEPSHRTVAEYLAARWLTSALQTNLSERRLEVLLHGPDRVVPTSLRGLHAWLATLDRSRTDQLVSADPYGCLRYGDPAQFTTQQVRNLLDQLQALADVDPYFRSEDWDANFGQGLARPEIQSEIVSLIRNPETPYQLSTVVLDSLRGTPLATTILDDLIAVIEDDISTPAERHAALNAIASTDEDVDWILLCQRLHDSRTIESLRLAIRIAQENISEFSGRAIADMLADFELLSADSDGPSYSGLGYRIPKLMSDSQLEEALDAFSDRLPNGQRTNRDADEGVEVNLLEFLQEYLERNTSPDAATLWRWLKRVEGHSFRQGEWNKFSGPYFVERSELRQSIQACRFQEAADEDSHWLLLHDLAVISNGLWLREEDVVHHMNALVSQNERPEDWVARWRNLVISARSHRGFTGEAMRVAQAQADALPELQEALTDLQRPPIRNWERELEERRREQNERRQVRARERHERFASILSEVAAGRHLHALEDVATAYLGGINEFGSEGDPLLRIEELVGSDNVRGALDGIIAASARDDIPTPREIAELSTNEGRRYFLERICIARCALENAAGGSISQLPPAVLNCALSGCQWGVHWSGNEIMPQLQEELEGILFSDRMSTERFIRDTIEPPLENGEQHVSGLFEVTHNNRFDDFIGSLSLEWLEQFNNISEQSCLYLIQVAVLLAPREELVALIRAKMEQNCWPDRAYQQLWTSAAFLVDYPESREAVRRLARADREFLWSLREVGYTGRLQAESQIGSTPSHLGLILELFATSWPSVEPPRSGWGDRNPYNATRFIHWCVGQLGANLSNEASQQLTSLIESGVLGDYTDYARHVLAQQVKNRAEQSWSRNELSDVRGILLAGSPSTVDDLQALVFDELELLQRRLRDGPTNGTAPFWNGDTPHNENYCRDRIVEHLEPHLGRFGVRVHTEGTMPDHRRCDFLNTFGEMDLPVEVKGQWHENVWNAACEQLEDNYTREYRAEGRGIYLVVWFGRMPGRNPPQLDGRAVPQNSTDMRDLIFELGARPISERTRVFVLDVSRGE